MDSGSTRLTVKRIDPEELLYFPETVEGLVAQVTFYSKLILYVLCVMHVYNCMFCTFRPCL